MLWPVGCLNSIVYVLCVLMGVEEEGRDGVGGVKDY